MAEAPATDSPESGMSPTVEFKSCGCGVLTGEECDCASFAASAAGLLFGSRAIMCRPASQWGAA